MLHVILMLSILLRCSCSQCSAGMYNSGVNGSDPCLPCPLGTFSDIGATICTDCTVCSLDNYVSWCNATSDAVCSTKPYQYNCEPGYYESKTCTRFNDKICSPCRSPCAAGYYENPRCSASGNMECKQCQIGYRCDGVNATSCSSGTLGAY